MGSYLIDIQLNYIKFILGFYIFYRNIKRGCVGNLGLKYFLVQACASFLLFFRGVRIVNYIGIIKRLIIVSLLIKLGAAPFYFWYLWVGNRREVLIYLSIIVGGVVGGIGGINEDSLRKLLVILLLII
ncbi:NADH-ubiquinone oxidoreductase chain 2 [Armadillidium vulgare]|nr:NADH-ubiquinone oxidoreductase chain 2 [Armadillidium vulgare]